jgi:hypothetical protein
MDRILEVAKRVDAFMQDLSRFKDHWIGRGWVNLFEGSKGFKDAENGVKVDVLQLIRVNALPSDDANQLDPYVREKFAELWQAAQVSEEY